jgi:parvulin-like peptidyl-prolyl isomerase
MNRILFCFSLLFVLTTAMAGEQEESATKPPVIASVNGDEISLNLFLRTLQDGVKKTFYHGKIPEAEFIKFRHKILTGLIDESLLSAQAVSMGLKADADAINATLQKYDARYTSHPQWAANKDRVLAMLRTELERAQLVKTLEQQVKQQIVASDDAVVAYYQQHPDKFTTPPQYDVAVILLGVDPSSGTTGWEAGLKEAEEIKQQLTASPEQFFELARVHSTHKSSTQGGELGLVHMGTLPEEVDVVLEKMRPGEISPPIRVLEGYAIVKLNTSMPAKLNSYESVKERAGKLCLQEMRELGWTDFVQKLKDASKITINMDEINKINITN